MVKWMLGIVENLYIITFGHFRVNSLGLFNGSLKWALLLAEMEN
jgi:hypothetical protein